MNRLSLEVRVGLLILLAAVLLGGFVLVLGGVSFHHGATFYVDFDNPGSVKPGAPVDIGGMKVGSVDNIAYRGNKVDPKTGRRSLIRVTIKVHDDVRRTIHRDALFYVTSTSVLGEQIIGIDPGSPDEPVLPPGSIVRGVDPPRLDLALSLGYELLNTVVKALRKNRDSLEDILSDLGGILHSLHSILVDNREHIDNIIANLDTATHEAAELARSARGTIDGPQVHRIVANLDKTLAAVSQDIGPIMADVRSATHKANGALDAVGGPEQQHEIRDTLHNASQLVADARHIVAHIRAGRGSVGALVMDEEIYDDLQEMLRDLKHNPWKFFWRE